MKEVGFKMKNIQLMLDKYPSLSSCLKDIVDSIQIIVDCYKNKGKLLVCGNGGSASDSNHIVGELMKSFKKKRGIIEELKKALQESEYLDDNLIEFLDGSLPAISLVNESSLITAISNDTSADLIFAQQVLGYGNKNDVLVCLSTSGNSNNVVYAACVAKAKKMKIISLTGSKESKLSSISDVCIKAPEQETFKIQELHLPIYHCICAEIEDELF